MSLNSVFIKQLLWKYITHIIHKCYSTLPIKVVSSERINIWVLVIVKKTLTEYRSIIQIKAISSLSSSQIYAASWVYFNIVQHLECLEMLLDNKLIFKPSKQEETHIIDISLMISYIFQFNI